MPRLTADFAKISHEFKPIPEGTYRVTVDEIKESETKENKLPQVEFHLKVTEGEFEDRKITDYVTLMQNDGKVNEIGYGRVKAYAIAILGEEAANGAEIDTDELKSGSCEIVVKHETNKKQPGSEPRANVKKVIPVG